MKKIAFALAAVASTVTLTSCDDLELDSIFEGTITAAGSGAVNGLGSTFSLSFTDIIGALVQSLNSGGFFGAF